MESQNGDSIISYRSAVNTLYGERVGEVLCGKIATRISQSRQKASATLNTDIDQTTAVLCCYPDHVTQEGESSLKTLRRFLSTYAQDIFSDVHVLPFYPSSSDGGYAVVDSLRVSGEYGKWADLEALTQYFALMVDLVANHVSSESEVFKKYLAGDEEYASFFITYDEAPDISSVYRPRASDLLTPFETVNGTQLVWTTFSSDQIDLNYRNPKVLLKVIDDVLCSVENGARRIRVDAASYLWKEEGASCFNMEQSHTIVRILQAVVREVAPNAKVVVETAGQFSDGKKYLDDAGADAIYNFTCQLLLLHTFVTHNVIALTNWINSVKDLPSETFLLNASFTHDGLFVGPVRNVLTNDELSNLEDHIKSAGGQVSMSRKNDEREEVYEFNCAPVNAYENPRALVGSYAILFALQGVPLVYLNALLGRRNWEDGYEKKGIARLLNREKFNYDELVRDMEDQQSETYEVYSGLRSMLEVRQKEPLFAPIMKQRAHAIHPVLAVIERYTESDRLFTITNVCKNTQSIHGEQIRDLMGKDTAYDILSSRDVSLDSGVMIGPYRSVWLK